MVKLHTEMQSCSHGLRLRPCNMVWGSNAKMYLEQPWPGIKYLTVKPYNYGRIRYMNSLAKMVWDYIQKYRALLPWPGIK